VNNLPKVVTQRCLEQDLIPRPTDRKPKCLTRCTTAPPVPEVNDKLKICANGRLVSILISFNILGLKSSAPGDLLLLKLIKTLCISKGSVGVQNILAELVGGQYLTKCRGSHFSRTCTSLSHTLEKYLFKLLQISFLSVTTPSGTVRLVITVWDFVFLQENILFKFFLSVIRGKKIKFKK